MKKKVTQHLGQVCAHYMYQADYMYSIDEAIGIFRNNIRNRKDLSEEFKNKALDLPIGRNHEIVYYPAHIYQTDTTKSWNTTSSSTSRSTYEGWDIKTTTTTTTRHTKGGFKKVSEAKFKSTCYELEVEKLDLNQTSQVNNFKSLAIPMYTENLFFTRAESGKNAIATGKEASNAGKNDSTNTTWWLHVVLIPILRYEFELCGKKCYFEMNLHNGTYITHYKQKGGCAFAHVMMKLGHVALGALAFLLPLLALITGFSKGFADVGFFKKAIGVVILGICAIVGLIFGLISALSTSSVNYEKIFYKPKHLVNVYLFHFILVPIIIILTLIFKNMAFL